MRRRPLARHSSSGQHRRSLRALGRVVVLLLLLAPSVGCCRPPQIPFYVCPATTPPARYPCGPSYGYFPTCWRQLPPGHCPPCELERLPALDSAIPFQPLPESIDSPPPSAWPPGAMGPGSAGGADVFAPPPATPPPATAPPATPPPATPPQPPVDEPPSDDSQAVSPLDEWLPILPDNPPSDTPRAPATPPDSTPPDLTPDSLPDSPPDIAVDDRLNDRLDVLPDGPPAPSPHTPPASSPLAPPATRPATAPVPEPDEQAARSPLHDRRVGAPPAAREAARVARLPEAPRSPPAVSSAPATSSVPAMSSVPADDRPRLRRLPPPPREAAAPVPPQTAEPAPTSPKPTLSQRLFGAPPSSSEH